MVSTWRLFKDYVESRSFSSLINVCGFVDAEAFLTKSWELGYVIMLRGKDAECLEHEQKAQIAACVQMALRAFDDRFVVQTFQRKGSGPELEASRATNPVFQEADRHRRAMLREKGASLYTYETFMVVMLKPQLLNQVVAFTQDPLTAIKQRFSKRTRVRALGVEVDAALRTLRLAVNSFLEQTADVLAAEVLPKGEAFTFLRSLLNPDPAKAKAVHLLQDEHVDYFAPDSELECYRDHLRLDDYFIKTLTLKQLPSKTYADMFADLSKVKANMMFATEWTAIDPVKAAASLRSMRRHWHNLKQSMFSGVMTERPTERDLLYDESNEAKVRDLGEALTAIEMLGLILGRFSLTVVIYAKSHEEAERVTAEVMKVVGVHDGALHEERYNGLGAFNAALPAGHPYNLRRQTVTNQNHVDMIPWFQPAEGEKKNLFLGAPALAVLETESGSLFYFNFHFQDVGHTLMLGPTGAGKSFALNFFIISAQQYDPYTLIFDLGGSFRQTVELLGGSYVQFRPEHRSFSINPFCLEPTAANFEFLFSFVKLLVESVGYQMTDVEERAVFEAIQSLYVLERPQRRLLSLSNMVPRTVGERLKRWTEGEQYGHWFDHEVDTVSFSRVQCIDFEGMERLGVVLEPLVFYLLHRANDFIYDPALSTVFKLCVVDEAWLFLKHPVTKAYIATALRTWRKKNAAMVLATQALEDLAGQASGASFHAVIESCPTKLLLANPDLKPEFYRDALRLNAIEQERVRQLKPKSQFLLKREGLSKTLTLNVDQRSYWLCTTSPYEARRRQELINQHGLKAALEILAGDNQ